MNPATVRAHIGGVTLSLPLIIVFASIALTHSLALDMTTIIVLAIEVFATLPWSAIAAIVYFLGMDLSRTNNHWEYAIYLVPVILIAGAYFNGTQVGRYLAGKLGKQARIACEENLKQ